MDEIQVVINGNDLIVRFPANLIPADLTPTIIDTNRRIATLCESISEQTEFGRSQARMGAVENLENGSQVRISSQAIANIAERQMRIQVLNRLRESLQQHLNHSNRLYNQTLAQYLAEHPVGNANTANQAKGKGTKRKNGPGCAVQ